MLSVPTFLLCAFLGLWVRGVPGLCAGAGVGWLFCFGGAVVRERWQGQYQTEILKWLAQLETTIETVHRPLIDEVRRFREVCIDCLPIAAYQRLEFVTERAPHEQKQVWALLRRRYIERYGIAADLVDASKRYLLLQRAAGEPMPTDGKSLRELGAVWEATFDWQRAECRRLQAEE